MEEEQQQRAEQAAQQQEHPDEPLPEEPPPGPVEQEPPADGKVRPDVVERLKQYDPLFSQASQDSGIPVAWLKGVAAAESSGNADSGKGTSGYKGLMQSERSTDQLDPATSINAGAKKLAEFQTSVKKHLGDDYTKLPPMDELRILATSYNAGPATVYKALDYARAAGDVTQWRAPENYNRELIYYGAYSTRAYAPKGTPQADIDVAEGWRKKSSRQDLVVSTFCADVSPRASVHGGVRRSRSPTPLDAARDQAGVERCPKAGGRYC